MRNSNDGKTWFGIGIDNTELRKDADKSIGIFGQIGEKAEAQGARIDNVFKRISGGIAGAFAATAFTSFISGIGDVRNEFEQLEISFNTMLGGKSKADALLAQAIDTAAKTPFDLKGVAAGYKQLLAYGFQLEKVDSTLKMIGDVAAGVAAPLGDIVYLYGTLNASGRVALMDIRQFAGRGIPIYEELAKVLGIAKEKVNEFASEGKISFADVEQAFKNMTSQGGLFNNLMGEQSKSIGGIKANFEDTIDRIKNDLGKKLEPAIKGSYKSAIEMLENYEEIGKTIGGLVIAYGSYKAVLITVAALQKLNMMVLRQAVVVKQAYTAASITVTTAEAIEQARTDLLTMAKMRLLAVQKSLNKAIMANPYVLLAIAVGAAVFGMYKLITAASTAELAQRRYNDETERAKKKKEDLLSSAKDLTNIVTDETKTIYQQVEAWKKLKAEMPKEFGGMTLSQFKAMPSDQRERIIATSVENKDTNSFNESLKESEERVEFLRKSMREMMSSPNAGANIGFMTRQLEIAEKTLKLKQAEKRERDSIAKEAEFESKPDSEKLDILNKQLKVLKEQYAETEKQIPQSMRAAGASGVLRDKSDESKDAISNVNAEWAKFDAQTSLNILQINALKGEINKVESTISAINKASGSGKSYAQAKSEAKAAYEAANKVVQDINKNATKYTQKQYEDAVKALEEKKKSYEDLGGVTKANNKENEDRIAREKALAGLKELEKKQYTERARIVTDAEIAIEQARINSLKSGAEKTAAQMELNHRKELEELRREQEDFLQQKIEADKALFEANPKNKDKAYTGAKNVALTDAEVANFKAREGYIKTKQDNERKALLEEQTRTMNEYLSEYGKYMERRQAITDLYTQRMKDAVTEGERLKLGEEMKKSLAEVDDEVNKKTSIITLLFEDMSRKSVEKMREIADEAQKMLDYIGGGEFKVGDDGQGLFGLTKEQFELLAKSPEKLQAIKDEIANVKREADACETSFKKMGNGLKSIFNAGKDTKKFKEGLEQLESGMSDVTNAAGFLSDSISKIADATGSDAMQSVADGLNIAVDAVGATMQGAKAGAMFGPIGSAAGAAIGLVSSLTSSLSKLHDAKHERKIQEIQVSIDKLQESYENLGDEIEKAYSTDASKLIEQQNTLLRQQQVLIKQQIEQEKQKKNTDKDKIKEWEQTYKDLAKQIEDNQEKAIDAIFGQDVKSAIDDFADAYVSAWAAGDDKMKSSKDLAEKMIKAMIVEAMKASIGDSFMTNLRAKMLEFMNNDGRIDESEQKIIDSMVEDFTQQLDNEFGWADKYMRDSVSQSAATYGEMKNITQDQASAIDGRLTSILMEVVKQSINLGDMSIDVENIKSTLWEARGTFEELRDIALSSVGYLERISKHTFELYEINQRLGNIEKNTSRI